MRRASLLAIPALALCALLLLLAFGADPLGGSGPGSAPAPREGEARISLTPPEEPPSPGPRTAPAASREAPGSKAEAAVVAEVEVGEEAETRAEEGVAALEVVTTGLRGRVVDESGAPVAGATVYDPGITQSAGAPALTASGRFPELWGGWVTARKTDAQGRFALPATPGRMRVVALAPGFDMGFSRAQAVSQGEVAALPDIVLSRLATGRLDIQVTRGGEPFAGELEVGSETVWVGGRQVYASERWRSDAQGRVRPKPRWIAGRYVLNVQSSAGALEGIEVEVPAEGEVTLRLDFSDAPRCELTVIDAESREPLPGLELTWRLAGSPDWGMGYTGVTDAQGKLWLHSLALGTWLIESRGGPAASLALAGEAQSAQARLEVGVGPQPARTLEVVRKPALRGFVLSIDGEPVAGAQVRGATGLGGTVTETDAAGRFELRPPYPEQELVATHSDHGRATARIPEGEARASMTLRFGRGARLSGRVYGPAGPIAGALIEQSLAANRVLTPDRDRERSRVLSDAEGRFEIGLPGGRSTLTFRAPGHEAATRSYLVLPAQAEAVGPDAEGATVLRAGELAPSIEVNLEAGGQLRGQVLGARPASGAWLVVAWPVSDSGEAPRLTTVTDEAGRFAFESLPNGRFELMAYDDTGASSTLVEAGVGDEVTLTMRPTCLLRVTLTGPSGAPVAARLVSLTSERAGEESDYGIAATDAQGRFEARVAADVEALEVAVRGYLPARVPAQQLRPGGSAELAIQLSAGLAVRGRILNEDGRGAPAVGIVLILRAAETEEVLKLAEAETDSEGRFEVAGLTPGRWQLRYAGGEPRELNLSEGAPILELGDLALSREGD